MKLILLAIFNIITFHFISSKNLQTSDIFKSDNKKVEPINRFPTPNRILRNNLERNYFMACC